MKNYMILKIFFLGLFTLISYSSFAIEFIDCSEKEQEFLRDSLERNDTANQKLLIDISESIENKQSEMPSQVRTQLINARLILKCAIWKKKDIDIKCTEENWYVMFSARSNQVYFSSPLFRKKLVGTRFISAAITHELTHKCGARDGDYFYGQGKKPHSLWYRQWQNIAATYDYWIMEGFCVPEVDC